MRDLMFKSKIIDKMVNDIAQLLQVDPKDETSDSRLLWDDQEGADAGGIQYEARET